MILGLDTSIECCRLCDPLWIPGHQHVIIIQASSERSLILTQLKRIATGQAPSLLFTSLFDTNLQDEKDSSTVPSCHHHQCCHPFIDLAHNIPPPRLAVLSPPFHLPCCPRLRRSWRWRKSHSQQPRGANFESRPLPHSKVREGWGCHFGWVGKRKKWHTQERMLCLQHLDVAIPVLTL